MRQYFFYILSLIAIVLLSSCATGPTQKDLDRRVAKDKMLEKNTNELVELFMNEVWNKPVSQLGANFAKRSGNSKIIQLSKPLRTKKSSYNNYSYDCMKYNNKSPRITVVGSWITQPNVSPYFPPELNKQASIEFSLGHIKKIKNKQNKCVDKPPRSNDDVNGTLTLAVTTARDIQQKLLDKGMPLIFCYEEKQVKLNPRNHRIHCSIDIGPMPSRNPTCFKGGRCLNVGTQASLKIFTSYNRLYNFGLEDLHIDYRDFDKTFSEIYYSRFQNPGYVNAISKYFNFFTAKHDQSNQKTVAKRAADLAEIADFFAEEDRKRSAYRSKSLGRILNKSANRLRNEKWGLSDPQIQEAGSIGHRHAASSGGASASSSEAHFASIDEHIPKGQPKAKQLQKNAAKWCTSRGGAFNSTTGKCTKHYDNKPEHCTPPPKESFCAPASPPPCQSCSARAVWKKSWDAKCAKMKEDVVRLRSVWKSQQTASCLAKFKPSGLHSGGSIQK